jgi:DNA-binding NarL/FixJ family response regulator
MTRVVLVADSGPVLASLTAAVATVPGAHIVRHGSSVTRLDRLVGSLSPDLVVIGDLLAPADALARLAEVRAAAPDAQVVVLSSSPEAGWLADALRAKASAVLPGRMDPETLGVVLREVLAERDVAEVRELRPRLVRDAATTGAAA